VRCLKNRSLTPPVPKEVEGLEHQAYRGTLLQLCGHYRDMSENTQAACESHRRSPIPTWYKMGLGADGADGADVDVADEVDEIDGG
jgi:hypothetical protein